MHRFEVWAPLAKKVAVEAGGVRAAMHGPDEHGWWKADVATAGPGTDYGHPLMAHSVLAHTLYQYLGTPAQHKRLMMDALYPRA